MVDAPKSDNSSPDLFLHFDFESGGTGFFSENIARGVDWKTNSDCHIAILHLGGAITKLDSVIEGKGGKLAGAKPGELWLIPAGHDYHSQAEGEAITYAVMSFSVCNRELSPQIARFDPFLHCCFRRMAWIKADDRSSLFVEQLQSTIQTHLFLNYGNFTQTSTRRVSEDVKFLRGERDKILDYIEANIDTPLRMQHLADLSGRTTHQFIDACHDAFGMSPARMVMEQRLRRARELLATSRETITSVALATGFSSHSHLIRAFQQHYAMTPGQFRSQQGFSGQGYYSA